MTKEIEEAIYLLMQLRIKSDTNGNRVDEKDLYDVQIMLYKAIDSITASVDVHQKAKEYAEQLIPLGYAGNANDTEEVTWDKMRERFRLCYLAGALDMNGEVEFLRDWKENAMKVMNDPKLQKYQKILCIPLGKSAQSIVDKMLPTIKGLIAEKEILQKKMKDMDEYAKQIAIEFAEWCSVNKYYFLGMEWSILEDNVATGKTTKELFQLFLEHKNKQP